MQKTTLFYENTESGKSLNIFEELSHVKMDIVKCRRCRPKGTKKPFWNFSSSKSKKSNKKRKAYTELNYPSKVARCDDKATKEIRPHFINKNENKVPSEHKSIKGGQGFAHNTIEHIENDRKALDNDFYHFT